MTLSLSEIWRHPLKAIGRETLLEADLTPGAWLSHDRLWSVAHDRARLDGAWGKKVNFLRGVTEPALMAVTSNLSTDGATLTLSHPEAGSLTFRPDDPEDTDRLIAWLAPLWPADRPQPTGIYRAEGAHQTDVPGAWISVHLRESQRALETAMGRDLSIHRWRGNLWLDGGTPWDEKAWPGRRIGIGGAVLEVKEEITRCKSTMANPETGLRDADTLGALNALGHQEFGVYAEVVKGGNVRPGDRVTVDP